MVKKLKRDDKTPVADVFDAILIESRQAATVTLMLDSPEEEVLIRACEAIFRYTDKAEENKKQMHELMATEKLMRLTQHPDKSVRRNSTMAIGVMAEHPEVRKFLRKRDDTVGILINLLSPDTEDRLTNEFASLCTSRLAIEYTGKALLAARNEIFLALIALLGSTDPDIQKNAIETLYQLIHDYKARSKLRDFDPWEAIFDLFESDFPVIQQLALQTVQKMAEDGQNRTALLNVGGISRLVDFIGNPNYGPLHMYAMQALSNCMEDPVTVQMMRESGSLARLTAFVIDKEAPEEDKDDKKKKGGNKSPKGGKRDESPRPGSDKKAAGKKKPGEKGGDETIIPTFAILKEHAALALARCARQTQVRQMFHEQNLEESLHALLQRDEDKVQSATAKAITVMSQSDICREAFNKLETVPLLVKRCFSDFAHVREASTLALANLTNNHPRNCSAVEDAVDLSRVLGLFEEKSDLTVTSVLQICTNLAAVETLRLKVEGLGIISGLLNVLRTHENPVVQSRGLTALSSYLIDQECRTDFRELGGCETLAQLVASPDTDVLRMASLAVATLGTDRIAAAELCAVGCVETLRQVQLSETRKNSFAQMALDKLLTTNLPMKYALYARLDPTDVVIDGFYDAGPIADIAQLATIESYSRAPINQRRPVLLVNAIRPPPKTAPQVAQAPVNNDSDVDLPPVQQVAPTPEKGKEGKEKDKKGEKVGKKALVEKKPPKGKQAKQAQQTGSSSPEPAPQSSTPEPPLRTPEPGAVERVLSAGAPPTTGTFTIPFDPILADYVDEVQRLIEPLPSSWHQAVTLAQYVSDKMGGSIDRDQLTSVAYELPLSNLKVELESNVLPIGLVKLGVHQHRALLFKVLADRISLPVSLIRGHYNRYANIVELLDDVDGSGGGSGNAAVGQVIAPKAYLVDLLHQPGRLMKAESNDAIEYMKL